MFTAWLDGYCADDAPALFGDNKSGESERNSVERERACSKQPLDSLQVDGRGSANYNC